jgi:hypothetical protein
MSSTATLSDRLITPTFESTSSFDILTARRRLRRPSDVARQPPDALLWGYDEHEERARYARVQQRLIRLEAALFGEFGVSLDLASKECLLRLFVGYPAVSAPLISAQANGILIATWRNGQNEELVIKCVSPAKLHYSIVSISPVGAPEFDRQWGNFHNAALFFSENSLARRIAS